MKISSGLTGIAGEYFVAAELSRRGYIASISLRNTRGIDILVTNANASRSVTIQCKAQQRVNKVWILHKNSETFFAENHFYVFIALGGVLERPRFHVVPSRTVADQIRTYHSTWLQTPSRSGGKHADTAMRVFADRKDEYLEKWQLLGL